MPLRNLHKKFKLPMTNVHWDLTLQGWVFLIGEIQLIVVQWNIEEKKLLKYFHPRQSVFPSTSPQLVQY